MKNVIIICNDSFGLDIKRIVLAINDYWKQQGWGVPYKIKGYIGDEQIPDNLKKQLFPYLGNVDQWIPDENEYYAMGIVDPHKKKEAVEKLKAKGARFETLWAPWGMAHLDFPFPEGCIVAAQSVMDSAKIGKFVTLFHSMVGFDAVVDDYSSIMAYANITTAHIGECVYFGDNAVVIGKTVNNHSVVLPNSVVIKEVKEGTTVAGNPARRVKIERK